MLTPISPHAGTVGPRSTLVVDHTANWEPLLAKIELLTKIVDSIADLHPYAKMAWSILSATHKMVLAQTDRDKKMDRLVGIMNGVFTFVHEAEILQRIESHRQILALMTQQTIECAYFIRGYAKNRNFWAKAIEHFMSDVDDKIKQYEDRFKELQTAFQNRATLVTEIAVLGILDKLDKLAAEPELKDILYAKDAVRFGHCCHQIEGDQHRRIDQDP